MNLEIIFATCHLQRNLFAFQNFEIDELMNLLLIPNFEVYFNPELMLSLSLCFSFFLFLSLCFSFFLFLSLCLFSMFFICFSFSVFIYLFIYFFLSLSLSLLTFDSKFKIKSRKEGIEPATNDLILGRVTVGAWAVDVYAKAYLCLFVFIHCLFSIFIPSSLSL